MLDTVVVNRSARLEGRPGKYDGRATDTRKRAPVNIEWLHPTQLFIDEKVLVNPRMPWDRLPKLNKIADQFDWNKFNPLTVVNRGGGKYAILNGGGSWWIVTEILPELKDFLLPCHVVDESISTRADEAGVFRSQALATRLTAVNFFTGDLIVKDKEALGIRDALREIGMIAGAPWPTGFTSIPLLRALYREGVLERTALIVRDCWKALLKPDNTAVVAVAIILHAHPRLDEKRLRDVLKANSPGVLAAEFMLTQGKLHIYTKAQLFANKYIDLYDFAQHKGSDRLLGGTHEGKSNKYRPGPRVALNASAAQLIGTWKMASKPAKA